MSSCVPAPQRTFFNLIYLMVAPLSLSFQLRPVFVHFLNTVAALSLRQTPDCCQPRSESLYQVASLLLRSPSHIFKCHSAHRGQVLCVWGSHEKKKKKSHGKKQSFYASDFIASEIFTFCSGSMKGRSSHRLSLWHIQPAPPPRWRTEQYNTRYTSMDTHRKCISGIHW